MKKVGKIAIEWRYKEIQGIGSDRVPEKLWMEVHNSVQELYTMYYIYITVYITAVTKIIPKKKKCKKAKWLSEET